jgi:hypothetical protein
MKQQSGTDSYESGSTEQPRGAPYPTASGERDQHVM